MPLSELESLLKQNQADHSNCLEQLAIYIERGENSPELIRLIEDYHYQLMQHEEKVRKLLAGAPMISSTGTLSHDENLAETMGRW